MAYKGKYPLRIKSVGGVIPAIMGERRGAMLVETNDGTKALIFANVNNHAMPKCGTDLSEYASEAWGPFIRARRVELAARYATLTDKSDMHARVLADTIRICDASIERLPVELETEELEAVKAFAAKYGKEWKEYLMAAWLSYAYKGKHMSGADTGTLRSIRNARGTEWLQAYKLPA